MGLSIRRLSNPLDARRLNNLGSAWFECRLAAKRQLEDSYDLCGIYKMREEKDEDGR